MDLLRQTATRAGMGRRPLQQIECQRQVGLRGGVPDFPFREPERTNDPWVAGNAGAILRHLPVPIVLIAGQALHVCLDLQACVHRFRAGYHTGIRGLEGANGRCPPNKQYQQGCRGCARNHRRCPVQWEDAVWMISPSKKMCRNMIVPIIWVVIDFDACSAGRSSRVGSDPKPPQGI